MPSPTLLTSLALACTGALAAAQGTTTRVSVNSAGFPWNSDGNFPDVSSNGKWIVFDSGSSNLVATDVNATWDVFLHDRSTGTTELVSTGSSGALGDAASYSPRISADGRFVVFTSTATNLVVGDANGEIDVFLRDRQLATTSIVSLGSDGAQGNDFSAKADLSDDGAFVVFVSRATNLVAGDTNGLDDVFVRDLAGGTTTLASVTASGVQGDHDSDEPRISGDGRFVAFTSRSTTFAPLDVATDDDVFLFDRLDPGLTLVSVAFGGGLANDRSSSPFISADGRYVVFDSLATNLVASDSNGQFDVFVRDLTLGTTAIASLNHVGAQVNATSRRASISDDGRRVAFSSSGSNVVAGVEPTPFEPDIFVRDLPAGTTERWSVASTGTAANDASDWATINGDGSTVVFTSVASNLIDGDINSGDDLFARDASYHAPVISYCTAKLNSQGCTPPVSSAGAPTLTSDDNFRVLALSVLNNKTGIFFWGLARAATPFGGALLCVQPPLVRSGLMNSLGAASGSSCTGSYSFAFDQAYMQAHGVGAGQTIDGQFWSRDPGFVAPNNIGLTRAIEFTVVP